MRPPLYPIFKLGNSGSKWEHLLDPIAFGKIDEATIFATGTPELIESFKILFKRKLNSIFYIGSIGGSLRVAA